MSPAEISENDFPDQGILWRGWDDETLRIIADKQRPVLLFVADPDPLVWPFLRESLHDFFTPLFIEARALPEDLKAFGAGSRYHVAVLSPHGFTPMVTVNVLRAPDEVIATIVDTLERLADVWRSVD